MKVCQREDRIRAVGAEAVFVLHDDPDLVRATMLDGLEVPFPILIDEPRGAYGAWGARRAGVATIFLDPNVWWQYLRLLVAGGERLRRSGRDPLQLGGDFIVAPDGTVAYSRPQRRDDRPPTAELIGRLEELAGGR